MMVTKRWIYLMLVLSIGMLVSPLIEQQSEASHCSDEQQAASDAHTDWDLAVAALAGAAIVWAGACVNAKTVPQIAACAGATVLLGVAVAAEQTMKSRYERKQQAFFNCLMEHQN